MDACTAENGPIAIWPGSHKRHLEHVDSPIGLEVKAGLIDPSASMDALAPPGSVMLFHSLLVHNSRPNAMPGPRRLMIYSHYPKAANMGFDVRNGPTRLHESPYELQYFRDCLAGRAQAVFKAPA